MFDLVHGLDRTKVIRENLQTDFGRPNDLKTWRETGQQFKFVRQGIEQCPLFTMSDSEIVKMFGDAFEPEFSRLRNASPTIESSPVKASGAFGVFNLSPSQLLFRADYAEVNRTIVGMLALKWIISGDYESFTAYQTPPVKLRQESFDQLRELFFEALKIDEYVYSLIVSMLVNDLGKDPSLRSDIAPLIEQYGYPAHPNHDMVVYIASVHGGIPLINEFEGRQTLADLQLGLRFGSELNMGQLAQAENIPGSMEKAMAMMDGHRQAFDLKFMELILDVAGAAGHDDARCAKAMVEPVFQTYMTTRQALLDILDGKANLEGGYNYILDQRGQLLQQLGFQSLSVEIPAERALLRLLTMSRTATKQQAELVADGFLRLPANVRQALIDGLSVTGLNDGTAILPYYMPALFAETIKATKTAGTEIKLVALTCLMHFLARVYRGTKPMPGQPGRVVEYDVSFAKSVIQSSDFLFDPKILDGIKLPDSTLS